MAATHAGIPPALPEVVEHNREERDDKDRGKCFRLVAGGVDRKEDKHDRASADRSERDQCLGAGVAPPAAYQALFNLTVVKTGMVNCTADS